MALMVKCGHGADARDDKDGPVCVIRIGIHPRAEIVDRAGVSLHDIEATLRGHRNPMN